MKEQILKKLKDLKEQNNIKILFAVESGSRVWNFASTDSDYDIRCVHASSPNKYLEINNPSEQIEVIDGKIDVCSWDVRKFMRLFYNSNPSVSEWLNSDIIYIESDYRKQLKEVFKKDFSRYALLKHYVSMARQHYEKYIRNHNPCSLKKYVYVLRAIACIEWILKYDTIPPIKYNDAMEVLPKQLKIFFNNCVELKKSGEDKEGLQNEKINREIEKYFDMEFKKDENRFSLDYINAILRSCILLT